MPDLLSNLIQDARAFLGELSENNSRDWWGANKPTYDAKLKAPALQLLDELTGDLSRLTGAAVDTKLFRPHRDVRFSKDKTPYNTHLHLLWSPAFTGAGRPGYFFGISPEYVTLGAGQMEFGKEALASWRSTIDESGRAISNATDALTASGFRLSEPALKRVPAPFDKNHPHESLLRHKGITAWRDNDTNLTRDQMSRCFEELTPLVNLIAKLS